MSIKSDGSTASYYQLPDNCTELQHLISHRDMNAQIGEIFRACYRYGLASHSDKLRDAKKIKFYADAEIERLSKMVVDSKSNDNDGWIEWHGGECPVDGGQMVEIKPNNLCDKLKNIAGNFYWGRRNGFPYEIIAYRVIKND